MIAGRYTLDREIGRGGMGAVWLGRDELLGRLVALKRVGMPPSGAGDNPELARAEREAKLAASLSHPHVVSVFDLAPDGDDQWLVMEYVEGTNLAELIRANGSLPPDQAAPILAKTADALIAAHKAGVVHRDVKPSNILVTVDGQVKLSDFGIARTLGDPSLTQTGLVTGSPAYLSPEVASGRTAGEASDIWSLGATAYHAVEGHPPYELGDNLLGALYRIVHEDPPRPTSPGWLLPLFEATMTAAEEDRWDATEVRDFLLAGPGDAATAARARPSRDLTAGRPPTTPISPATTHPTQVLQAVRPPGGDVAGDESARRGGRRLTWLLIAVALVAAVLVVVVLSTVLGGADSPTVGEAKGTSATPSTSPSTSPSARPKPDAESMRTFIDTYLRTAPVDQDAGYAMLTPAFQKESQGRSGYRSFWSTVSNVSVNSIEPDPAKLQVTYDYSYVRAGRTQTETITLDLAFDGSRYLIAGES